jgi:biotin carboxylase
MSAGRGTVITAGNFRQTLTVVRALGRAGYRVIVGRDRTRAFTEVSRHASGHWNYDGSSRESFVEGLVPYLKSERPDFFFPIGELSLERVARDAAVIESLVTCVMPHPETVLRCLDKRAMNEVAAACGIPVPGGEPYAGSPDAWRLRARELGFPVIVKRKDSFALVQGRKALILRSADELDGFLAVIGEEPEPATLLLQKYAAGYRHNCHFAAADGELVAFFQQKVLRTDTPDGTGYGVEGISVPPSPVLRAHCERLLERLRYTGVGCVQFLVDDATGSVAFLELNPRLDATTALPYRCGYDFPRLAVELAAYRRSREPSRRPAPLAVAYPVGARSYWFVGDLFGLLHCVNHRKVGAGEAAVWCLRMAAACLRSRYHLTWDARDPRPTLFLLSEILSSILRRFRRRKPA